jgi:hypothetical protein
VHLIEVHLLGLCLETLLDVVGQLRTHVLHTRAEHITQSARVAGEPAYAARGPSSPLTRSLFLSPSPA